MTTHENNQNIQEMEDQEEIGGNQEEEERLCPSCREEILICIIAGKKKTWFCLSCGRGFKEKEDD